MQLPRKAILAVIAAEAVTLLIAVADDKGAADLEALTSYYPLSVLYDTFGIGRDLICYGILSTVAGGLSVAVYELMSSRKNAGFRHSREHDRARLQKRPASFSSMPVLVYRHVLAIIAIMVGIAANVFGLLGTMALGWVLPSSLQGLALLAVPTTAAAVACLSVYCEFRDLLPLGNTP